MIRPVGPRHGAGIAGPVSPAAPGRGTPPFEEVLAGRLGTQVRFSGHAQDRLTSRQVQLSPADVQRLEQAVTLAREKGARDTLVVLDRRAFIVSVPSNTVVTVMPTEPGRVFTNIDSAVVL